MNADRDTIPLWWLAMAATLLPLLTIHTTFVVSVLEGHVPWCIPHLDSCTSISRTGRHGTSYFIFKGAMLPASILGILFWFMNARWLLQLGAPSRGGRWIPWLALVACLSLAAYVLALGHEGAGFNLVRRIGVVLYFSLTFIAQLIVSSALSGHPRWRRSGTHLLWLCQLALSIGVLSVILSALTPELYGRTDDAIEWILALLLNVHAIWIAALWRKSGFRARLWTE